MGCNSVIHQTGVNSVTPFAEAIHMEIVSNITFPPNIFSQIVILEAINTTNFHLSRHVLTLFSSCASPSFESIASRFSL